MTRTRKMFLVAAALLVAAAAAPAASAAPAPVVTPKFVVGTPLDPPAHLGPYVYRNFNSDKCLLVKGTVDRSPATQFGCGPYNDQQYWLDYIGTSASPFGYFWHIRDVKSGLCLVVQGSDEGSPAFGTQCDTPDNRHIDQQFYRASISWNGALFTALVNYNSGKCLVVRGEDDGSPVVQTTCFDSNNNFIAQGDAVWREYAAS